MYITVLLLLYFGLTLRNISVVSVVTFLGRFFFFILKIKLTLMIQTFGKPCSGAAWVSTNIFKTENLYSFIHVFWNC